MSKTFDPTFSRDSRSSWTRRGKKACPVCGQIQGQRRIICINEKCTLRQKQLCAPFDPIKLISNSSTAIYSLRKEKESHPRNFAEISEIAISFEENTSISRSGICFVEKCNYDSSNSTCKHIKACQVDVNEPIPVAEVYALSREVLWNLNIDIKQKQRLWDMYMEEDSLVPAIQRLNATTFAVKCDKSSMFPAGRLHVTAISNSSTATKRPMHACACKKLKIILEPDNSVVMQEEICDHLLLVLAAVLSKPNGKHLYKNFTNALKTFWMPTQLEQPVVTQDDAFFGLDINIGNIVNDNGAADDIFIFDDKFLTNDSLPDFTDIVLDLASTDFLGTSSQTPTAITNSTSTTSAPLLLHAGDPNLVSSCNINEEDIDICFDDITTAATTSTTTVSAITAPTIIDSATQLELSDCNIELMDQFQLTDRIDLCSDDIDLEAVNSTLFENENSISVLTASQTLQTTGTTVPITISLPQVTTAIPFFEQNANTITNCNAGDTLLKPSHNILPIELPPIAVVKKTPIKAAQIVSKLKTRKFPPIPAKRTFIVNTPDTSVEPESTTTEFVDLGAEPTLAYSAWLEHVIETINESIEVVEQTNVMHTFHVHEEIFSHFSKSFSVGIKYRMPNVTKTLKSGKYKGLIMYTWNFPTAATVRRIFSTKNLALQIERAFEKTDDGDFVPYIRQTFDGDAKKQRIYPKLALYMAHIWFDSNDERHKTGFKIEWLPNAYPKSHFGILKIEFSLGIKDPFTLGISA